MTRKTWLLVPTLAAAGLCLTVEDTRRIVPGQIGQASGASLDLEPSRETAPALPTLVREAVPVEKHVGANEAADSPDSLTPGRPGPEQALLRVEVVALETGKPLSGARLFMSPTDDSVEHEWISSTQPDPSRGVENDDVLTDAEGRGEFVLQTGFAYTLTGGGENGLADEGELALEPLRAGEEREVCLALRTSWDFDWHGRVEDGETGLPIVGAEVIARVNGRAQALGDLHVLARARSGPGGHVVLRLPDWEHAAVSAEAPGYSLSGVWTSGFERSVGEEGVLKLLPTAALDARVVGADGHPAAEVEVRLSTIAREILHLDLPDLEWSARTDSNGRCSLAGLPARARLRIGLLRVGRALQRPQGESGVLELEPGESRTLEWRLQAGCRLTGVVRDPEGRPMPDVPFVLLRLYADELWKLGLGEGNHLTAPSWEREHAAVSRARSDATGRFVLDEVPPGAWSLAPDAEAIDLPQAGTCLEIAPGARAKEVVLELAGGLWIQGRVLAPDGDPAAGVCVSARQPGMLRDLDQQWCARDGTFRLGPLYPGEYEVDASPDDPLHAGSELVRARAGEREVTLRLRRGGTLAGEVVDAETGEPVDATVALGHGYCHVLQEGFSFEHLLPGAYDLVARTGDGGIGVLRASVHQGERNERLALPVRMGARLAVRTQAPDDVYYRYEVEWQGLRIGSSSELKLPTIPPGPLVVRWFRIDRSGERLEHEESRIVGSPTDEIVIEHTIH